jgi:hypothetical protein
VSANLRHFDKNISKVSLFPLNSLISYPQSPKNLPGGSQNAASSSSLAAFFPHASTSSAINKIRSGTMLFIVATMFLKKWKQMKCGIGSKAWEFKLQTVWSCAAVQILLDVQKSNVICAFVMNFCVGQKLQEDFWHGLQS